MVYIIIGTNYCFLLMAISVIIIAFNFRCSGKDNDLCLLYLPPPPPRRFFNKIYGRRYKSCEILFCLQPRLLKYYRSISHMLNLPTCYYGIFRGMKRYNRYSIWSNLNFLRNIQHSTAICDFNLYVAYMLFLFLCVVYIKRIREKKKNG